MPEAAITLSTHVLDLAAGRPAAGLRVALLSGGLELADRRTDDDGRIGDLGGPLPPGSYRLLFHTGEYFADRDHLFEAVSLDLRLREGAGHHHLPLLLSPFGCTSYRGT